MRNIDVEIRPVDRLVLKHHMIDRYVRHGSCYPDCRLRSSTGPRTHRASSCQIQGMSLQARPVSTQIGRESPLSSAHDEPYIPLRSGVASFDIGDNKSPTKRSRSVTTR